jgi:hypothetical protein
MYYNERRKKMKKLLLVLLIVALASFLYVGCLPVTPAEGEGEGEGEGEVTVEIDGAVVLDNKTYVSCGTHTITVTFPAPMVGGVIAFITDCNGYYGSKFNGDQDVVLFPDAERKVWSGSGYFGCNDKGINNLDGCSPCCASYVVVEAGECEAEACIWFPVIVDCDDPFALIEIDVDNCECAGCEISFETITLPGECYPDLECCGDYCSGLASWSIVLYDGDPFDECCDPSVCEEPIGSCSGTDCPISCVTDCLTAGTYYAVITLIDEVGNETVYYAKIVLSGDGSTEDCDIDVYNGSYMGPPECIEWEEGTTDTIGICYSLFLT